MDDTDEPRLLRADPSDDVDELESDRKPELDEAEDGELAAKGVAQSTASVCSVLATTGIGKRSNSKVNSHCESDGPAGITVPGFIGARSRWCHRQKCTVTEPCRR